MSESESRRLIGQLFLDVGYLTREQLDTALERQREMKGKQLGEVLVELGYLNPGQLENGLAVQRMERWDT